jgi:hypothetical protein
MRPAMPVNQPATVQTAVIAGPIVDGTVLNKAPDDVGGLLDTSKGWTLNIPGPEDSGSAASKLIAAQERKPAPTAQLASAAAPAPAAASR